MAMKNPIHPDALFVKTVWSPLTRQALNNVVNQKSGISPEKAVRLSKACGSTLETQATFDLAAVMKRAKSIRVERSAMCLALLFD